jgi:nucleoside-diphosphate-sugar epimerase
MKILVTGANGFIGRSLCAYLRSKGHFVRGAVRVKGPDSSGADEYVEVGDINGATDWQQALAGVDAVVHLAARVHIMHERDSDSLGAFRRVNVLGTERLARMAAKAGVKRFVFISSVKVNGEGSDEPYTEKDIPKPEDAYGLTKREAEEALTRIAAETGLEAVILRLSLVYGPYVKANFRNLTRIAGSGLPLPLKGIHNRRSFLYLGNLVDAILTCLTHPRAAGETFLLSDGEALSTPDLLRRIAQAMNKKVVLFSVPSGILKALCKIAGKSEELKKLTGSLLVDSTKIRTLLGWQPPFTMEEGIRKTLG